MLVRFVSLGAHADFELLEPLVVIGRHVDCDVRIISSRVSRRHCCLALGRDDVAVRDLNSANGTWVNGRRVSGQAMGHGDELAIARYRYRLELNSGAATKFVNAVNSDASLSCARFHIDQRDDHADRLVEKSSGAVSELSLRAGEPQGRADRPVSERSRPITHPNSGHRGSERCVFNWEAD